MKTLQISIHKDFSDNPAGRYKTDGPKSGEHFRDDFLIPALVDNDEVTVILDDVLGFGSSFLEEAFGGLIRCGLKVEDLKKKLKIISSVETYSKRIWRYISQEASRKK